MFLTVEWGETVPGLLIPCSICSKIFCQICVPAMQIQKIDPNRKIQLVDYTRNRMESLFLYLQQFMKTQNTVIWALEKLNSKLLALGL